MKRCLPSSVFSFPAANDYDAFHWIELPTPNQTRIIANQSDNVRSVVPIDHCNAHTHTHTHTSASTCPFFSSQAGRTFIQFFLQSTGTFFCACVCVCVCVRLIFEMKSDVKMMPGDRLTLVAVEDAADEDSER